MNKIKNKRKKNYTFLSVKTVNITELIKKINLFVSKFVEEIPKQKFDFTLNKEEYLQKIQGFNEQFGDIVLIEVIKDNVIVKFPINSQQLAEKFVELGTKSKMKLESKMGPMNYSIFCTEPEYVYVNFFLPSNIKGQEEKFDFEKHKNTPTIILPYLNPTFSNKLIQMYLSQKLSQQ